MEGSTCIRSTNLAAALRKYGPRAPAKVIEELDEDLIGGNDPAIR